MAKNLFSVPIFFIVFRETLEAAIIVSVLLGLAEQIVHNDELRETVDASRTLTGTATVGAGDDRSEKSKVDSTDASADDTLSPAEDAVLRRRLIRKLRLQIFLGAGLGLFIALAVGAAFIAVWFTKASDLWAKSEELWEAKAVWRVKLQRAFDGTRGGTRTGKWALFILPLITVLREGLEAVIFVGGVSLGQPATSIPIAAIVGLLCGFVCGFLIYEFASRSTLTVFLVVMTNFLLLIGAGLFSKAVGSFEEHAFIQLLGADADDAGNDGPGSYRVQGNVWHLDCCNPDSTFDGQGWTIFNAIFGWNNNATQGSILSYVFYWLAVVVVLIYMKFTEGRTKLMGRESAAGARRQQARDAKARAPEEEKVSNGSMEKQNQNDMEHVGSGSAGIDMLPR
ncbi:hypothetical protein D9619_010858 [Psilocybe cf. subviscida]|uniref:Iron permease FTR1 n=1 Tax=Psilocybe cf. subviscida TaxID=2480587 RepID=A0A8H5B842_9AGAR|nr:hypothetical protein D9619_010858 [Psilocybe cf. subviscida]